ncbi:DUF3275 family protein [Pseudomonas gingeri]|uniref:DUF3275 family protein n=1 Tax=Pseudomonas gingeri TaxID=117681 RepID=UPI0015A1706E|nr:DUF3275 family protein [Pseudomonas gingeri]NVZ63625.1 DUF3275 family protein [Pseudomonas gingeri]
MINIPGQLAIQTITGRNGDFNVGRLSTSIGEFVIKDALLEQYNKGKYRGNFAITGIRSTHYSAGGRLVVEIRAELASMSLDDVDKLTVEDTTRLTTNEPDPLDEETPRSSTTQEPRKHRPAAQPTSIQSSADDAPFGMESSRTTSDAELFGTIWPLGKTVRLDTTVDRQRLRAQCTRLGELGYVHDFKQQSWNCQSHL